jgi:class 3 adenylate cyclase
VFKHTGDGVCAAFASPPSAVDAAVAAQRALEFAGADGVGDR